MYEHSVSRNIPAPKESYAEHDDAVLRVENLTTYFETPQGMLKVVDGVSFTLRRGRILGILGESGCGKTVTNLSIIRLLPKEGRIAGGGVIYRGLDILRMNEKGMRCIRGGGISMIFQEPSATFNPFLKISTQMIETIRLHKDLSKHEARRRAVELLDAVGIADPERRIEHYPHQFSGGMLQRVLVSVAVGCDADVILADEPTSDLDVTSQDRTLDLLASLSGQNGTAILLVTHDFGVAARMCDTICVMYAGRVVEAAPVSELYRDPKHPYTKALMSAIPDLRSRRGEVPPAIGGKPPDFRSLPAGCAFHPRCAFAMAVCRLNAPPEFALGDRTVRCWLYGEREEPPDTGSCL